MKREPNEVTEIPADHESPRDEQHQGSKPRFTGTLAERGSHLAVLRDLLEECDRGVGGVAVVSGPVTCGKTSLLREFVRSGLSASGDGDSERIVLTAAALAAEQPLPFGVVMRLFRDGALADLPEAKTLSDRMEETAAHAGQGGVRLVRDAGELLLDLAQSRTVVVAVDDVHHADPPSLNVLLHMMRHGIHRRVLLLLSAAESWHTGLPDFHAELTRARCRWVDVNPLSPGGVLQLLGKWAGGSVPEETGQSYFRACGGNPLLLQALLKDSAGDGGASFPRVPVVGKSFARAVSACLHRDEPVVLEVAQAVAVLGEWGPADIVRRLVERADDVTDRAVSALARTGLLDHRYQFRHPAIRDAVLETMSSAQREELSLRAATLLRRRGAAPLAIAVPLLRVFNRDVPWGADVLIAAAEAALVRGDTQTAFDCVEHVHAVNAKAVVPPSLLSALARTRWQADPGAVTGMLGYLCSVHREGRLSPEEGNSLVLMLAWHGRCEEAAEVLRQLRAGASAGDALAVSHLAATELWLRFAHPTVLPETDALPLFDLSCAPDNNHWQAAAALTTTLAGGGVDRMEASVCAVLECVDVAKGWDDAVVPALLALVYADRLALADEWCERLLAALCSGDALTLRSFITGISADIALRRGDARLAESLARSALSLVPAQGWGAVVGYPVGTLIAALTALGRHDEAADRMRDSVPESVFSTPFGVHYLYARGLHSLATGRDFAALDVFRRCGALLAKWDLDVPTVVAWRSGMAQAYLALNRVEQAKAVLQVQAGSGKGKRAVPPAVRGATLRLLATTAQRGQRLAVLRESVRLLDDSDHDLDLVLALADLSNAYYNEGDSKRARATAVRAMQAAARCHAEPLVRSIMVGGDGFGLGGLPGRLCGEGHDVLTDAEYRIAMLAAGGLTNREIARKACLTVSTVEQHLTRIYRKLKVAGRAELGDRVSRETPDVG